MFGSKNQSAYDQPSDLVLEHNVMALDGSLLLPAGSVLSASVMKGLISSRKRAFRTAFLLKHGTIRNDIADLMCTPPYDTIFKEAEVIDEVLREMECTQLAVPLLEALDYFRTNDFYSYRHCLMVFALSMLVAGELVPDYKNFARFSMIGPVHDIGMACVPLHVLKKNMPLTSEEKSLCQSHSAAGYVLLSYYLGNTINPACVLARDHHEKRDGSGYPRGSKLTDIFSEITSVCDIYDALLSPRPYRTAPFDNRSALEEITKMAQEGRVRWEIVKVFVALNRRRSTPHGQADVSLDYRGEPPANNLYGILENGHHGKARSIPPPDRAMEENPSVMAGQEDRVFPIDGWYIFQGRRLPYYRILFEQSPDGILLLNAEGEVVHFNGAAHCQTGYTEEEFAGIHISRIFPFIGEGGVQAAINDFLASGSGGFETVCLTKNGAARNIYITSRAINLSGRVFFHMVFRDITRQKEGEEALLESEAKYRCLVESMGDSIYVVDRDYKYVFMNKRQAMRMGLSENAYAGRSYSEFHTPEETAGFIRDAKRVFETGEPSRHEYTSKRDGRQFIQILSPIRYKEGKMAVAVISRDITSIKVG